MEWKKTTIVHNLKGITAPDVRIEVENNNNNSTNGKWERKLCYYDWKRILIYFFVLLHRYCLHTHRTTSQALRLYIQDAAQIWRISLIIILCHGSLGSRQLFIEWHVDNIVERQSKPCKAIRWLDCVAEQRSHTALASLEMIEIKSLAGSIEIYNLEILELFSCSVAGLE